MAATADLVELYAGTDATGLAALVRAGEVSPVDLVETAIALVEDLDPLLNAVPIRSFDAAQEAAAAGPGQGPLAGVPFLLKNIGSNWKGIPLTAGFAWLKDFVPDQDSPMAARMRSAGLIPIGRSNTPEGGWSIGTEPRLYGPARNPWNPEFTPGGSSGGAAAAVAAGMVPIAEATDGGGSIRVPAACCGLVGLKPSRGRISYGAREVDLWFGSIGTLCNSRSIRDTALFLDVVAGAGTGDPYLAPAPGRSWAALAADDPGPLRSGSTPGALGGAPTAGEIDQAIRSLAATCAGLGHTVEEHGIDIEAEEAWARYNDVNAVETAADLDRLAAVVGRPAGEDDLAPFNRALVAHGRSLTAVQYARSIRDVRVAGYRICRDLERFDVFLTPVLTQPVRPVGYWSMEDGDRERYLRRWSDAAYMFLFNISGLPAMSVPAGFDGNGLPIGVQFVGRHGDEATVLRLGRQIEEAPRSNRRRPMVFAGS